MYEEEKFKTTTEPAADKQTKAAKPKRTDEEKLQELYDNAEKLKSQQTENKRKIKVTDERIAKNNSRIAVAENKELTRICKEKKITTKSLLEFLKKIPEGTNLEILANSTLSKGQSHSAPTHFQ
jgi:peptidoglycan hydrolase CwlO-like protein